MTNAERLREILAATKNGQPITQSKASHSLLTDEDMLTKIKAGETIPIDRGRVIRILAELENTAPTLVTIVKQMRTAQKNYFATHGGLDDCKKLERAVDQLINEHSATQSQRPLFSL